MRHCGFLILRYAGALCVCMQGARPHGICSRTNRAGRQAGPAGAPYPQGAAGPAWVARLGWRARYERLLREAIGEPSGFEALTQHAVRCGLRQGLLRAMNLPTACIGIEKQMQKLS